MKVNNYIIQNHSLHFKEVLPMKQSRARHLLLGAIGFLMALGLFGPSVRAQGLEIPDEIADIPPEDTEYDRYTDPEGIQPYASPLNGRIDNIIVFVRFNGESEYVTQAGIGNAQKIYNTGDLSLKKYLTRISYGNIDINTYFYPADAQNNCYSVEVSQNADYYKKQYTDSSGNLTNGYTTSEERRVRENELITDAVNGVKDQLANSGLELDQNRDGHIDGISFVVSVTNPYSENIDHGDLLWDHKSSQEINVPIGPENLTVYTYNLINKGTDTGGILAPYGELSRAIKHEFLHTLSLPDLYRYSDSTVNPLGPWDIMDKGNAANITAWYQREYLEFGAKLPVYTSSAQGVTLNTAKYTDPNEEYAAILKSSVKSDEYFVVENRAIDPGDGGQKNAGLLVYRIIDSGNPPSTSGNSQGPPDFIYAFRPNESSLNAGDGDVGYATLSPDNPKGFTSLGKPLGGETPGYDNGTIYYANGSNSGIVINNLVKNADGSMTFDVSFPEPLKGSGTQDDPYELYTVQDLYALSSSAANTYYRVMNDIDLSGMNFMPIAEFKGILDGNGKTIRNLNVSAKNAAGFISDLWANALVKNLTFDNPVVTVANDYAGIFSTVDGILENITVIGGNITSELSSYSSRAGGLAGILYSKGVIRNCYTSATVNAKDAGGLISYLYGGTIENSYACGKVNGTGDNPVTGGILAYWYHDQGGTAKNTYWDIRSSGQTANGLLDSTDAPADLAGCYGIKIECPGSIEKGYSADAKIICENGTASLNGTWESSDSSVISVNASTGSITGKKAGTASISYRFPVGSYSASLSAEVTCTSSDGDGDGSDNNGGDNGNTDGNGDNGNTGDNGNNNTDGDNGNTGGNGNNNGGDNTGGNGDNGNTGGNDNIPVLDNGSWIASGGRWWFRSADGSYPSSGIYSINGSNFAFDANGWMITGWYQKDGCWYYFNGSGYMHKGWILLGRTWYYLDPANGKMLADGIHVIGGSSFAFHGSGAMVTGWYRASDGNWYYFSNSGGYMHKGWILLGRIWYYLDPANGKMLADGIHVIGGSSFAFHGSGAMVTGWYHASGGNWYYFSNSGYMHTGWILLGRTWYYLDPADGKMLADGIHAISGSSFAFRSSGAMVTGWYLAPDGFWYYFNGSGHMHKGWILLGRTWYYLNPADGKMYADQIVSIDGRDSSFSASGAWLGYVD